MCKNIDDFNRGCALIMGRLYGSFPKPIIINVLYLDEGPEKPDRDALEVYGATVEFLGEEGYVRFGSKAGPEHERLFMNVRLTSKGLAALNRSPESLTAPKGTIGDRVVAWSKDTIAGVASDAIRHAVAVILG